MDTGFPYGDIIIVAALAAFILLRYRAMLGERTGRDAVAKARPFQELERVIQLPLRTGKKSADAPPEKEYGAFTESYRTMRGLDKQFSPEEFLTGAKHAYEMVLEAFNTANNDTLKNLLSDTVYEQFAASLAAQEALHRKQQTTLIALTSAEVVNAELSGTMARLTVKFISEQVMVVRDVEGNIVEGNPSHQHVVEDQWVFSRNLSNADPAWKIIET